MDKLQRSDLLSLENYAQDRTAFRDRVMLHKKNRKLELGPNATIAFEDRLTIQYQIQEMLRVERIFESQGIEEELTAYNPLIPDGNNWKATFMIEFTDPEVRQQALQKMLGIEDKVWIKIGDYATVYAIADEDMDRTTAEKTSAVHFLRFQLNDEQISAIKSGASVQAGIDHENYCHTVEIADAIKQSLIEDLN